MRSSRFRKPPVQTLRVLGVFWISSETDRTRSWHGPSASIRVMETAGPSSQLASSKPIPRVDWFTGQLHWLLEGL